MQNVIVTDVHLVREIIEEAVHQAFIHNRQVGQSAKKRTSSESEFLTTAEACKALHCSRPHLYKLQRLGFLRAFKVANHSLFSALEIEAYIISQAKSHKAA